MAKGQRIDENLRAHLVKMKSRGGTTFGAIGKQVGYKTGRLCLIIDDPDGNKMLRTKHRRLETLVEDDKRFISAAHGSPRLMPMSSSGFTLMLIDIMERASIAAEPLDFVRGVRDHHEKVGPMTERQMWRVREIWLENRDSVPQVA